jgi:hypothetical protein
MKVEIMAMCDFAQADPVGKLTIVGIFDTIHAVEVPKIQGLCALAIKMRFDKSEEGLKKINISIADSSGKSIMPSIEALIQITRPPNTTQANLQIVSLIPQLSFPNFGEYSVDLNIDGKREASTPIFLRQAPIIRRHLQTPPQTA